MQMSALCTDCSPNRLSKAPKFALEAVEFCRILPHKILARLFANFGAASYVVSRRLPSASCYSIRRGRGPLLFLHLRCGHGSLLSVNNKCATAFLSPSKPAQSKTGHCCIDATFFQSCALHTPSSVRDAICAWLLVLDGAIVCCAEENSFLELYQRCSRTLLLYR